MRLRLVPLLLVSLACAPRVHAQDALVLSGGGARGLAHVGAILHLDSLGFDPDIVIGNSMGAVVGALYAAGYAPEEIRARVLGIRWGQMFDPAPVIVGPDRALRLPSVRIDLDVARRSFTRGLFGEWRVNRALVRLLFDASVRAGGDFDRLPRRFRAVAADLVNGAEVVLDSGDLARATRASMAYPGFFAPVNWGERVLVDGGIANNFPTDVARRLGARRIVGVDVTRPPSELESLAPLVIVQRSLDLMQQNLHADPQPPDVLILPGREAGFAGPSFPEDPLPVIERGRDAARRDARTPLPSRARARTPLATTPASFARVTVEAEDSALAAYARRAFADVAGRPYDPGAVLAAVDRLYATGLVEGVWPRVAASTATSAPTLIVQVDAPPPTSLAIAGHYENDRGGRLWGALDRQSGIGRTPAVFSLAGTAGGLDRWAAASARVFTAGPAALTWSAGAHVREQHVRFFGEDSRTTLEWLRAGGWLAVEVPHILRERLASALIRGEWIDGENGASGYAIGPLVRFSSVVRAATVVGAPFLLEAERRWGSLGYTRVVFTGTHTVGRHGGVRAAGTVDLRGVSEAAPLDVQPSLGDDHAIPGLRWGEFRGRARAVAGGDLALPLRGGYVRLRARTGTVVQDMDALDDTHWVTGGQLGVYWPTPLGVLEAGWGLATRGDGRFDVSIGRNF